MRRQIVLDHDRDDEHGKQTQPKDKITAMQQNGLRFSSTLSEKPSPAGFLFLVEFC
jgi:hypothetical protein